MGMPKTYTGTFTVGSTTASYDLETTPENFKSYAHLQNENIYENTKQFIGEILQFPPQFSAIKKNGKPLYLSARKGIEVKVEARPITIYSFEITNIQLPIISFSIECSTGTYIRSLANDFGEALGVGAHLSSLRRTYIGNFAVENATSISDMVLHIQQQKKAATV
jgi:tRNA pseudouridine55 synthase